MSCCWSGGKRGWTEVITSDFIETIEMRGRFDNHLDEAVLIGVGDHFFNHAHRQSAGKDLVAARGQHAFAGL